MNPMTGRCLCGAISFEITPPTLFFSHCHCQSCRRSHGAAFVSWSAVPRERYRLCSSAASLRWYRSSPAVLWGFCGDCGSSMLYDWADRPERMYFTVASLDGPMDRPVDAHVSYEERVPWFVATDGVPQYRGKGEARLDLPPHDAARLPNVVNVAHVPLVEGRDSPHWGHDWKALTPAMPDVGHLRVNLTRLRRDHAAVPFHSHQREDEVIYVLSGRGVLRYGDDLVDLYPGDCVALPRGTGKAHQVFNPHDEELVYLCMGPRDPDEVCVYPDSGKVMVRALKRVGYLEASAYMAGEPELPRVLELVRARSGV